MAWRKIQTYSLAWNVAEDRGGVILILDDGARKYVPVDSPEELSALGDILRNEKAVYYGGDTILTSLEPPGDIDQGSLL